jgi:2-keto-4-pentenoate hydratase/2-oxohepta-3-ene-1,7-dioic acid hydratase in catechol pathway
MRLASFAHGRGEGFGVVAADHVIDLSGEVPTLRAALSSWGIDGLRERARAGGRKVPLHDIAWLPPITDPDKILCVGLNYHAHAKEAKMAVPERPSIFVRFASSQVGHQASVVRPRASPQFDYEAELAVVIGKPGRHISEAQAFDHVAGYSCFAENSVRDWQTHSRQATPGKNFERSGAFGPWLVTPDEAGPVEKMDVIGRLNGREMQRDSAANMIFSVPQQIAYLSTFTTLLPGDVIVTGTPAGVGFTRTPPVWLQPGDRFDVEVTGVGVLSNPVIEEPTEST